MPRYTLSKRYTDGRPNLVILHPAGTLGGYPFHNPNYKRSYLDLFAEAAKVFSVYYVRGKEKHRGQGAFADGYYYQQGKLRRHHQTIVAKVIYNKNKLRSNGGKDWAVVNPWKFYMITQNKYNTYRLFKKYMKPTYQVRHRTELRKRLPKITTRLIVYKPLTGSEGKGIVIGTSRDILRRVQKPAGIIQAFIDTRHGIAGITSGRHDMRITIMNGSIVQSYVRIPKKGRLVANVAQGGTLREIPGSRIPRRTRTIALSIDRQLRTFGPRVYSIDFGFEKNQPYIIELNPQPGLPYPQWKHYYAAWHRSLVKTLASAV